MVWVHVGRYMCMCPGRWGCGWVWVCMCAISLLHGVCALGGYGWVWVLCPYSLLQSFLMILVGQATVRFLPDSKNWKRNTQRECLGREEMTW